jgi:hypothetical protein
MALTLQEIKSHKNQLAELLSLLKKGETHTLEYGAKEEINQTHIVYRIRATNTACGTRYCLKQVLPRRGESTLGYFGTDSDCLEEAMKKVIHYHSTILTEVVLSWYPLTHDELISRAKKSILIAK